MYDNSFTIIIISFTIELCSTCLTWSKPWNNLKTFGFIINLTSCLVGLRQVWLKIRCFECHLYSSTFDSLFDIEAMWNYLLFDLK